MSLDLLLFRTSPYIGLPLSLLGWLGWLLLLAGFALLARKWRAYQKSWKGRRNIGLLLLLVFGLLLFVFQVRQSEVAVVTTFGNPTRPITDPGAYLKWPWPIQKVDLYDNRVQTTAVTGEETAPRPSSATRASAPGAVSFFQSELGRAWPGAGRRGGGLGGAAGPEDAGRARDGGAQADPR